LVIVPFSWALVQWTETRVDRAERARVSRAEQNRQAMVFKLNRLADELEREEQET
jgi:hypothetical protein